ncbi:MAG: hypothetical protein ABI423_01560 [Burkholderiales bacterium]
MRNLLLASLAGLALAAWTGSAGAGFLSATRPVIAMLGPNLFVGDAEGNLDGAGTLAIHAQAAPSITCTGEFTSSAEAGGVGKLKCSDGATSTFKFQRLTIFSGQGRGAFGRGTMSFTYGLTLEESKPYLVVPAGKRLELRGNVVALVD